MKIVLSNPRISYYTGRSRSYEAWLNDKGNLHREEEPVVTSYFDPKHFGESNVIKTKEWYHKGKFHRDHNPARLWYYSPKEEGGIKEEQWWYEGKRHREYGPATTQYYSTKKRGRNYD